jgi:hypothetical protein
MSSKTKQVLQKVLTANILFNKNNEKGLKKEAAFIEFSTRKLNDTLVQRVGTFRNMEPREHPIQCDVQFHIDYPSLSNLCWARINILIINPAEFGEEGNLHHFDFIIFRDEKTMTESIAKNPLIVEKSLWISIDEAHLSAKTISFETQQKWKELWTRIEAILPEREVKKHIPSPIEINQCPPISVITLLHNRRKFFDIAAHNMLLTDYPRSKIEWILVDDSDDMNESPSDKVIKFQNDNPDFGKIVYVPLGTKISIGAKRNLGVSMATSDIILMMDDDDHYPQTSFRRRVSWLRSSWPNGKMPSCCGCATIAMYDLVRAVSAVNIPPLKLPIGARLSEASLTFYKGFWEEQMFPEVNMAEGEEWIKGREIQVMEIPPQHIIVAFNHKQNSSTRKIPDSAEKGCFWGFPKEYLEFIHKIAGMEIDWQ